MRQSIPDERVMEIVEAASSIAPDSRPSFIRDACGGDAELERCVIDYVHWKGLIGNFLEGAALDLLPPEEYFRPGDVLLNRFRVIREAGRGGMGIVYEAFDPVRKKNVALKCAHSGFDRQLTPEVEHASEVSHPNVCKIFDIHQVFTAEGEELNFISMEFLSGQTLANRMDQGPLSEPEAKRIAIEICRGLSAAHRNRVIHGDLKPNNIILASDATGASRSVITDFGLARHREAGHPGMQSGPMGGAPTYMAPELLQPQRGRPTVASDIYALGVVLRELFSQCADSAKRSRKIPAKWAAIVARAHHPDPARRFESAEEIARALDPRPQPLYAAGAAAAILYLLFAPAVPKDRIRLAVLPFAAPASVGSAAESLYLESSARIGALRGGTAKNLTVIPAHELRQEGVDTVEEARAIGASHALVTHVAETGERYKVEAQLIDIATGAKFKPWSAEYRADELRVLPVVLAGVVSGGLHLPPLSNADDVSAAARADYEEGLRLVRRNSQADAALAAFERAAAIDPDSALIRAGIAEACWFRFFNTKDRRWLDRSNDALRSAQRLNPDAPQVRKIAGLLSVNSGWFEEAIADYKRAIELMPSDSDAWRRLGMAYQRSNQMPEAEEAFREAVKIDPQHFKTHQDLGSFYFSRADYRTARAHFEKAAQLEPNEPDLHFALGACLLRHGDMAAAEKSFRTGLGLAETAKTLDALGLTFTFQARDAEAIPLFERATAIRPDMYLYYLHLGMALRRSGRAAAAKQAFDQALRTAELEVVANPRNGFVRAMLAYAALQCGDRRRSEADLAQALHFSPNDNDAQLWAILTYELLGKREDSLRLLSRAGRGFLDEVSRWPDLGALHRDPRFLELQTMSRTANKGE